MMPLGPIKRHNRSNGFEVTHLPELSSSNNLVRWHCLDANTKALVATLCSSRSDDGRSVVPGLFRHLLMNRYARTTIRTNRSNDEKVWNHSTNTSELTTKETGRVSGKSHNGMDGTFTLHVSGFSRTISGPLQYKDRLDSADGNTPRDALSAGLSLERICDHRQPDTKVTNWWVLLETYTLNVSWVSHDTTMAESVTRISQRYSTEIRGFGEVYLSTWLTTTPHSVLTAVLSTV